MKPTSDEPNLARLAAGAGPECLNDDQLRMVVDSAGAETELSAARQHLDMCAHCASELSLLRNFLEAEPEGAEAEDVRWIVDRLRPEIPTPVENAVGDRSSWWNVFRFPKTWMIPVAAAALVLLTFGSGVLSRREPALRGIGGGEEVLRSGSFELLAPLGELAGVPSQLEWEAVIGAATYVLRVYEVDRSQVLSETVAGNRVPTPIELNRYMIPGKSLLWDVEALGEKGQPIAKSETGRFLLVAGREVQ